METTMRTKQHRKSRMGRLIVPAITGSFLAYFAFHAQSGRFGLEAKSVLATELVQSEARYAKLLQERQSLERRVQLLHDGTLERDMIDERARESLGYVAPDEIAILR
ncbi:MULTISPECIES: FtsB family cell division protein [unclassified Aureimonas]|uniref:FtsB family cell division protein n=1 Tax=unclassified Aureimonas TaxID=2615206 RepID=UPI000B01E30A|nr:MULTISPECIES: septum formation initiator family protein [unclassified Aureimonas]